MKRLLASVLVVAMLATSTPCALADGLAGITILRPAGSVAPTAAPSVTVAPTSPPVASAAAPVASALAQQAITSAPVAGDLTHLTFTATANLWAQIESPADNSVALGSAAVVEVRTGLGQGAEVRINGQAVPFANIGRRIVDTKEAFSDYTYYGVPLGPGANHLVVTPLGAGTLRGTSVEETLYGPGLPATLSAQVDGKAVADGASIITLRVKALDQAQHPAMPGSLIKGTIDGDAHFILASQIAGQAPMQTQSVDMIVQTGGIATARIVAGLRAGDATLDLDSGDIHAQSKIFFAPALRAPMVLGLATIGAGSVPGAPGEDPTAPGAANSRRGRIALYASGDVGNQTLATLAYDTADVLTRTTGFGAFSPPEDPQNRPYETYGDSSITRDDALSNDHLYLRLDRGRSNFTWGEFQAQTGDTTGANAGDGFNLLVDGAKLELATNATKIMTFNARNDIAYGRQIFSPLGLSSLGSLLQPNIVVGSDIVTLVVLDRRTGAILQQTTMTPNSDYTIDYNTGQLRFINIPLPFDQNFNPQEIVVQYEYDGTNLNAETSGGRVQVALGASQKTHLGVGYVNDSYGSGNFSLLSADMTGVLPGGSWSIEHLTSQGALAASQAVQTLGPGTGGNALRAALDTTLGKNKFDASFDSTSEGFDNPFGGLATPGLLDYRLSYSRLLNGARGELTTSYEHEQNNVAGVITSQDQASIKLHQKVTKRFTVTAEVDSVTGPGSSTVSPASPAPGASPAAATTAQSTATQAQVGFDWLVLPKVDLAVSHLSDVGGGTSASQPPQTSAELGVNFSGSGRAYIRELWSGAPVQSFASSTAGLVSQVSGTHSTDFGIQHTLGPQTTVSSDYTISQTGDGNTIYSSLGVQEKLPINKHLHGALDLQHATGVGQGVTGFNVYGFDLTYNDARLRASESYQLRTGDGGGATLLLGATGAISPDFSLFADINDSNAGGISSDDSRVGIAYRPSENDRAATLVQYEAQVSNSSQLGTKTRVLSVDQLVRPTTSLEIAGRYAYKLDGDSYYPAQTELFGLRATQRIGSRLDIGSEVRYLDVRNIPGASAMGFAVESGLRIGGGMRLALGYNFSGAPDPSLAAAPTRRGVYVTLTSVIDRILGWGR
jgi:hypothetical protein